jgi:uncharacterized SAM-binding protein YcdF (DUF218 family)
MVYSLFSALLQPSVLLLLLLGIALVRLWRHHRELRGRLVWLVGPYIVFVALCLPPVGYVALGSLEWGYPPCTQRPLDAQAIVVLGGGVVVTDAAREEVQLDQASLYRCLQTAKLYHQGSPCLVLVTGGKPDPEAPGPPCADLMHEFLLQLGVPAADTIVENQSRTTFENAAACRTLLEPRGIRHVVLVTDATHLHRACGCFAKQGIEATPSGCTYRATRLTLSVLNFLPTLGAAQDCQRVFHEWLGIAWYWFRGRI